MSWTFHLQRINESFAQIANWYKEFMHRTEQSFRVLHQRILSLEDRQGPGPSDEQVERVLRKILAERFGEGGYQAPIPPSNQDGAYFVEPPNSDLSSPQCVNIDVALLQVDPAEVPTHKYKKDFEMLERDLADFPAVDLNRPPPSEHEEDVKDTRQQSQSNHDRHRLWS